MILKTKKKLSLINNTNQIYTYLTISILNLKILTIITNTYVTYSIKTIKNSHSPFNYQIHTNRPQHNQSISTTRISKLLLKSQILQSHINYNKIQNTYYFKYSPQIHKPIINLLIKTKKILEIEINNTTNNPLIFINNKSINIINKNNFHNQNITITNNSITIAYHEITNITKKKINQILNPQ